MPLLNHQLEVFAVEHDSIQLSWGRLPEVGMTVEVGDRSLEIGESPPDWYRIAGRRRLPAGCSGPGAVTIDHLDASTNYDVVLSGERFGRRVVARARTMDAAEGRLLSRFATISDCHFGERTFAPLRVFHDPRPRPAGLEPYTVRCAVAAIAEAEAWGAELLVAKGDLTQDGKPAEISTAIDVLSRAKVPIAMALGNHDVRGRGDAAAELRDAGFNSSQDAAFHDLPGVRLVLGHSPIPRRHVGSLPDSHIAQVVGLAAGGGGTATGGGPAGALGGGIGGGIGGGAAGGPAAPAAVVVVLHHPLQRWPVETHYPPSVRRRDSRRFASALIEANPSAVVVSGHTHRNRLYRAGGVLVAEVGSTKDYPGQWAGYSVFEGGIRQVVRRIERPDAIAWNEMTKRALGGVWGWWSPGALGDRCWTLHWPDRVVRAAPA